MVEKITMKTSKKDMLKAYNELSEQYDHIGEKVKTSAPTNTDAGIKTNKQTDSESYTVETIVKDLADLKLDLNQTLTDISDKLLSEVNTLEAVKKEIRVKKDHLRQIHNIQIESDSLKSLIQQLEDQKISLEQEIASIKEQWKKEQKDHEQTVKERDELLRKVREREEEEYNYNLLKKRKREKETFDEERTKLQKQLVEEKEQKMKDIKEREERIKVQEDELAELRNQVKNFPTELSKTIDQVKQETKNQIEKDMKQKDELQRKEVDGERKVYELKIKNLEDTMMKQAMQIDGLSKQLDTSSAQVLNIANKAIEGASGYKYTTSFEDNLLRDTDKIEKIRK